MVLGTLQRLWITAVNYALQPYVLHECALFVVLYTPTLLIKIMFSMGLAGLGECTPTITL